MYVHTCTLLFRIACCSDRHFFLLLLHTYFPCRVCLFVHTYMYAYVYMCIYVAIGVDLGRPVKISLSPTLCKHLLSLTTEARKVLSLHYWTTTTAAKQSTNKYENDKEKDVCLSRLQAHEQAHTSEPPKASLDSSPLSTGTTAHTCSSVPSPSSPSKEPPSSSLPSSFPAAYTCTTASNSSCHFEFPTLNVSTDQVVVELSLPPPPPPLPVPPFLSHLSSPSCPLKAESDLKPSSVFLTPTVAMGRSSPKLVDEEEEEEEEGGGGGGRREGEGGSGDGHGLDEGLILSWQCCSGLYPNAEGTSYIHVLTYTLHTYACCVTVFCHVVTS